MQIFSDAQSASVGCIVAAVRLRGWVGLVFLFSPARGMIKWPRYLLRFICATNCFCCATNWTFSGSSAVKNNNAKMMINSPPLYHFFSFL